jgi:hypothetical protein
MILFIVCYNVKRHKPRALTLDYQTYRTLGMLQRQCYNPLTLDISYFGYVILEEELEDAKVVIRIRKSKKYRQHSC